MTFDPLDPKAPAVPLAAETDVEHVIVNSRGEVREHYDLIYTERDVERIRLGYCCINCGESQVGKGDCPFPEKCWVCGFHMRTRQPQRFAVEFKGNVRIGPSTSDEEELLIAEEYLEREKMKREGRLPSGIVLPRGIHAA